MRKMWHKKKTTKVKKVERINISVIVILSLFNPPVPSNKTIFAESFELFFDERILYKIAIIP